MLTLAAAVSPVCDLRGLSGRGGWLLAYVAASLVKVAEAGIGLHVGVKPTRLCLLPCRSDGAVVVGPVRRQSGLSVHGTYRSHCGDGEAAALLEALVGVAAHGRYSAHLLLGNSPGRTIQGRLADYDLPVGGADYWAGGDRIPPGNSEVQDRSSDELLLQGTTRTTPRVSIACPIRADGHVDGRDYSGLPYHATDLRLSSCGWLAQVTVFRFRWGHQAVRSIFYHGGPVLMVRAERYLVLQW